MPTIPEQKKIIIFIIYLFTLLIGYYSSFTADWHFDDIINIIANRPLHISDMSWPSIKSTFFAYPEDPGKLLRPVSNFSFALNWLLSKDQTFSYHIVNFVIHLTSTFFLFFSCFLLLRSPRIANGISSDKAVFVAALAAFFWAINPMQVQAVTYIVQRMAALAAMFSIIGIFFYLKMRFSNLYSSKFFLYLFATVFAYFFALGSKENAVLLPFSLALIEIIFFQRKVKISKTTFIAGLVCILVIAIFTILLGGPNVLSSALESYSQRDFTIWQRLLTESRIVVFYLSQLFYPLPSRLSLTHDIQLSTSLFDPITTIISVLLLLFLTIFSICCHRKNPLISFAIIFFLLNHVIESTIIPLELIFEHRNYLPSLFLFLPISLLFINILSNFQTSNKIIYYGTYIVIGSILLFFTAGTISRNYVWHTEKRLWEDSLSHAQKSTRPYINLGFYYLSQEINYKKAFELNYLSLSKYSPTPWKDRLRAYNNLGHIMTLVGDYDKAIVFFDKALKISEDPSFGRFNSKIIFHKAKTLWLDGKSDQAIETMSQLCSHNPNKPHFHRFYGELLIGNDKTDEALAAFQVVINNSSIYSQEYALALLDYSLVFARKKESQKAKLFNNLAIKLGAPSISSYLCLIENNLHLEKPEKASRAIESLLTHITWPQLIDIVEERSPDRPTIPFSYTAINKHLSVWLKEQKQ